MMRLLLLAVCCAGILGTDVHAEPLVFFRNKKLTLRHYVYGEVTSSTQTIGTINLGYGHGLSDDQELPVIRRYGGQLIPVGILRVTSLKAGEANGHFEGELPLQKSDIVLIAARKLDLWSGRSRTDQLVLRTLISDRTRGYDTGNVSPRLAQEVGRDDDQIGRLPLDVHVNQIEYDLRRPVVSNPIVRGAFAPSASAEVANAASEEDRILAEDKPTLDLEHALVRFVRANAAGAILLSETGAVDLARTLPGEVNIDQMQSRLKLINLQIRNLLSP